MRNMLGRLLHHALVGPALLVALSAPAHAQTTVPEPLTFDEAVQRALDRNPSVAVAAQSILRAEAVLQQTRTVYYPTLATTVTTTVLNEGRGFDGLTVQPQTQSLIGAQLSYPVLAPARWALNAQAEDQIRVSRISVEDTRRQVAVAAGQAYLAVMAERRQVEVNARALENARAHLEFARARLDAGAGSKLNELRAAQEVATSEVLLESARLRLAISQEALGVVTSTDGAVDAVAEPHFDIPAEETPDWLVARPDVRLFSAQVSAAERIARDSWREWAPTATAIVQPQYVTPAGLFQPSQAWNAVLQVSIPLFDGGLRRSTTRQRELAAQTARLQLSDVELRARADLRLARHAVASHERALVSARQAAEHAAEVVRISDIAYRAGATTNLELIDAQRRARDVETAAVQVEDRVRQAKLELLVALGRFPASGS